MPLWSDSPREPERPNRLALVVMCAGAAQGIQAIWLWDTNKLAWLDRSDYFLVGMLLLCAGLLKLYR